MTHPTPWKDWHQHFKRNRLRALPRVDNDAGVPTAARTALSRSLAIFQVGEGGEGRIASDIDRCRWTFIDDDYRHALKLFVAEEGRHARILGQLVRATGGEPLERSVANELFVIGRRLVGVRHKLLVLLAAEVIGITFYKALAGALDDGDVQQALLDICADEEAHLAFHLAFFQHAAQTAVQRAGWRAAWAVVARAAAATVLVDHAATLRALGISVRDVRARFASLIATVDDGLSTTRPQPYTSRSLRNRRAAARETCTSSPDRMRAV